MVALVDYEIFRNEKYAGIYQQEKNIFTVGDCRRLERRWPRRVHAEKFRDRGGLWETETKVLTNIEISKASVLNDRCQGIKMIFTNFL